MVIARQGRVTRARDSAAIFCAHATIPVSSVKFSLIFILGFQRHFSTQREVSHDLKHFFDYTFLNFFDLRFLPLVGGMHGKWTLLESSSKLSAFLKAY